MKAHGRIAIFPGTFDPITNGHLDVIRRGEGLFDHLVIAVAHNPEKRKQLFTLEERGKMIAELVAECCTKTSVRTYRGLTVDFAREIGATVILRGLRNVSDLHYEFQLALTNRAVADIETLFIMSGENYGFTSSSLIRQIAAGGDIDRLSRLLPALVVEKLKQKKKELGGTLRAGMTDDLKD